MRIALVVASLAVLVATVPAAADMDKKQHDMFVKSCTTQLFESGATCECMAKIAGDTLTDDAILYLSIQATDVRNSAALAKSMSQAEINSIDKFMQTVPKKCRASG
jgi:hypothetical protein